MISPSKSRCVVTLSVFILLCMPGGIRATEPDDAIDLNKLNSSVHSPALLGMTPNATLPNRVSLRIRDDQNIHITDIRIDQAQSDLRWSWSGRIEDENGGDALFAVNEGYITGVIRSPDLGVFRIRSTENPNTYSIEEFQDHGHAPCIAEAAPLAPGVAAAPKADRQTSLARGAQTEVFDLLVGYTEDAKSRAGGMRQMLAEIDLAVLSSNSAFNSSNINARIELVRTYLVHYPESGSSSIDLQAWRGSSDGYMDEVHQHRLESAADLCALLVNDFEACGRAYIMQSNTPSARTDAFSVTDIDCAVGNLSFIHEIGHNLGCAHDRDNAISGGVYSYSYGRRDPSASPLWRTIMSYAPGARIRYFSNPDVLFNGMPLGVPTGPTAANNSRSINDVSATAASFFPSATRQPMEFDLLGPDFGIELTEGTINFRWEEIGPVRSYSLIIAADPELKNRMYVFQFISNSSVSLPLEILSECETVYWSIDAVIADSDAIRANSVRSVTRGLRADLNMDNRIDEADLGGLLGSFGSTNQFGDLNRDGRVDTADLGILLNSFGEACN